MGRKANSQGKKPDGELGKVGKLPPLVIVFPVSLFMCAVPAALLSLLVQPGSRTLGFFVLWLIGSTTLAALSVAGLKKSGSGTLADVKKQMDERFKR